MVTKNIQLEKDILISYAKYKNIRLVSLDVRASKETIRQTLINNKILMPREQLTIDVITLYKNLGSQKLVAKTLNICENTARNILKKNNIKLTKRGTFNRKYFFNEHYFDNIDSYEKAYMLGYIFGDGNLNTNKGRGHTVCIELANEDKYILEEFAKLVGYNGSLYFKIKKKSNWQDTYSLRLHSKAMFDCLVLKYGLKTNKTWSLNYPENIPDEFHGSFILGLNDSDGHIHINKSNSVYWDIIGTPEICDGVKNILSKNGISSEISIKKYEGGILNRVRICDTENILKLKNFLYSGSSIFLFRKRKIFDDVKYRPCNYLLRKTTKLNDEKVIIILKMLDSNISLKDIAKNFNVSISAIRGIKYNTNWKHIKRASLKKIVHKI